MSHIFGSEYLMFPIISLCVMVVFFLWWGPLYDRVMDKSLSNREEVLRLMDLMFIQTDRKRVTILLTLLSLGLGIVVFLLFWPNFVPGLAIGSVVGAAGMILPVTYMRGRFDSRATLFVDQMVDGLTIMANGIKAGLSVTQAMERVVDNMPNPISQEFNLVLSQIRIGRSVEDALIDLGTRLPKADVQMFVTAINILKETGGNLAETFQTIVHTIRERQKVEKRIQAMTAQGVTQGMIISVVPVVLMAVLLVADPKYIMPMFTTSLGWIFTAGIFVLIFIGGMLIRKIVKIQV